MADGAPAVGVLMRVRFLADFDFRPPELKGRYTIAYRAKWEGTVRRCCGTEAVAKGKAIELPPPRRDHA